MSENLWERAKDALHGVVAADEIPIGGVANARWDMDEAVAYAESVLAEMERVMRVEGTSVHSDTHGLTECPALLLLLEDPR